ncbi:unnamed protein product [Choristocarpus tenellus]
MFKAASPESTKRAPLKTLVGLGSTVPRGLMEMKQEKFNLLRRCEAVSSQDHANESGANTLEISLCRMYGERDGMTRLTGRAGEECQQMCGCGFMRTCYWSSAPSPRADCNDWLEYSMVDVLSVVTGFVVRPYTACWQPECPTYSPKRVQLQLIHREVNGGKPYYESEEYPVNEEIEAELFILPKPVLCLGGGAVVRLIGKVQRQTLGPGANHYYTCVSHVAVLGSTIPSLKFKAFPIKDRSPESAASGHSTIVAGGNVVLNSSTRPREGDESVKAEELKESLTYVSSAQDTQNSSKKLKLLPGRVGWFARKITLLVRWRGSLVGSETPSQGGGSSGFPKSKVRVFESARFQEVLKDLASRQGIEVGGLRLENALGEELPVRLCPCDFNMKPSDEIVCVLD